MKLFNQNLLKTSDSKFYNKKYKNFNVKHEIPITNFELSALNFFRLLGFGFDSNFQSLLREIFVAFSTFDSVATF